MTTNNPSLTENTNVAQSEIRRWQTEFAQSNTIEAKRLLRAWKDMARRSRDQIARKCQGVYYAS